MDKIWAPWRSKYILNKDKEEGCILCNRLKKQKDEENYILYRGKRTFIIMNIFPYNNGHLMVAPYRHTGFIEVLDSGVGKELFDSLTLGVKILKASLEPDGFNLGMNLGRVAGAGIEDHLHIHIVPRWNGDTNFMPVLTDTKILSFSLDEVYKLLRKALNDLL
ncbi:MAG: HIT domain-containing protein [Candidatus Cloacimonadota bacterium]|nr:MAG: HIT domain-containing protein [Candidatus Cloacimonadota bacterium]